VIGSPLSFPKANICRFNRDRDFSMLVSGLEIAALLFDLDNTLVDRDDAIRKLGRQMYTGIGVSDSSISEEGFVDEFFRIDAAGSIPDKRAQMTTVASELSTLLTDADQLLDWRNREYPTALVWDQSTRLTLDLLNKIGVPWGIVTNGSPIQQTVMENLGMYREASAVVVSSLVELRKPDKRIFELAMSLVAGELSADKFLFVGDNPTADIVGASEAGNKTAWLYLGAGNGRSATAILTSLLNRSASWLG
jgi:putative hydrolase of the HAD superfamily